MGEDAGGGADMGTVAAREGSGTMGGGVVMRGIGIGTAPSFDRRAIYNEDWRPVLRQ